MFLRSPKQGGCRAVGCRWNGRPAGLRMSLQGPVLESAILGQRVLLPCSFQAGMAYKKQRSPGGCSAGNIRPDENCEAARRSGDFAVFFLSRLHALFGLNLPEDVPQRDGASGKDRNRDGIRGPISGQLLAEAAVVLEPDPHRPEDRIHNPVLPDPGGFVEIKLCGEITRPVEGERISTTRSGAPGFRWESVCAGRRRQ